MQVPIIPCHTGPNAFTWRDVSPSEQTAEPKRRCLSCTSVSGLFLRLSVSPCERDLQIEQFLFTDVTTTKVSGCQTPYKYVIKMRQRQTCAEGFIKLWVEAPSARPSWGDLKATEHPGLVWGQIKLVNGRQPTTCWHDAIDHNLGWNYWRGKQGASWHSQEYLPLQPGKVWQSGE